MAARRKKAARQPAKPARAAKPKKQSAPAAVEGETKPGMPIEVAIGVVTAVLLFAAIVLVDYKKGTGYGTGLFFKGSYDSSSE